MDETRTTAELEQTRVRVGALGVHLGALVLAVVLVGVGAGWPLIVGVVLVAAIAGAWAVRMYSDLQAAALQDRAMAAASRRFVRPEAATAPTERFDA
jgi:hypothetical protein